MQALFHHLMLYKNRDYINFVFFGRYFFLRLRSLNQTMEAEDILIKGLEKASIEDEEESEEEDATWAIRLQEGDFAKRNQRRNVLKLTR